ncbi:MAG: hypothetical protein FWC79_05610 [Oscillospiraceae bacterium]|nr:hypothetical protein [Oscillospiraceae bacterium]
MATVSNYTINIDEDKPQIIEAFVAVYGEKHRETFIERLDSVYIDTLTRPEDMFLDFHAIMTRTTWEFLEYARNYLQNSGKTCLLNFLNNYTFLNTYTIIEGENEIDLFTSDTEKILLEGSEIEQAAIKEARRKVFRKMGFKLGKDYNTYINNDDVRKAMPTIEEANNIAMNRNAYYSQFEQKCKQHFESYDQANKERFIEHICKTHNLKKEDFSDVDLYEIDQAYEKLSKYREDPSAHALLISINGENYLIRAACFPPSTMGAEIKDMNLIHELGHCLCQETLEDTAGVLKLKTGLDHYEYFDKTWRNIGDFTIADEILHHRLSQEVLINLQSNGTYLLDKPGFSRTSGDTYYEDFFPIFESFYHEFKPLIADAMVTHEGFQTLLKHPHGFSELTSLNKRAYRDYGSEERRTLPVYDYTVQDANDIAVMQIASEVKNFMRTTKQKIVNFFKKEPDTKSDREEL